MIPRDELLRLLEDLESYRVERQGSLTDHKDKVEQAICAYSNDLPGSGLPGVVAIGLDDKTGAPTGFKVTDELLKNLAHIRDGGKVLPFPELHVERVDFRGESIAVVVVEPSPAPPVRLDGRTWIRVGPRRATATRDEERTLVERRRSKDLSFDQQPVPGARLEDLDLRLFQQELLPSAIDAEVLRENGRSLPEQLAALHLASREGIPNVAGLIILGLDPTAFIPGARVQFVRYDGTEVTDPILDQKELVGPLPEVLRRMDDLTNANNRVATEVGSTTKEVRAFDYPMKALQQLLRNAVMHRNYETSHAPVQWYWFSDRIELHNPGGLFGRATPDSFGHIGGNDYRNPVIAAALKQLGFVQQFGMGVPLARKDCAANGNPPPEFKVDMPSNFAVIVRRRA